MGLSDFLMRGALACGLALPLVACDELPDIPEDVCGNKLVEPKAHEVCDGFATAASSGEHPTLCGEPGQRFQCQYVHDAGHDCPAGYGAGLDGLCREALGVFTESPAHIDATGASMRVADFDGDARSDIVTWTPLSAEAKVTYLGADLQQRDTALVKMSRAVRPPTTGFLGKDAAADIVLADPIGVLVFRGRSDLTFEPKGYATTPVPAAAVPIAVPLAALVPVQGSGAFQGAHFVAQLVESGGDLRVVADPADDATPLAVIPNASLSDLLGVTLVDLEAAGAFADGSEEIVLALAGQNERIVAITPNVDPALQVTRTFNAFGLGRDMVSGPFKVDSRIGIGVAQGDARSVMLLSAGDDNDLSAVDLAIDDTSADAATPIAMGSYDLFGVKLPFVVLPYQILLQTQFLGCALAECFTLVGSNTGLYPWSAAAVDERNAIVVAGTFAANGLDAFRYNAGASAFNVARISTDAPVIAVYPGNFDGDGATDFLIRTRFTDPGCDDDTRLAVSWGDASGFPSQPVSIGDVPGLTWVAPGSFAVPPQIDAVTDFVVKTNCEGASHSGLFLGTATRQLESPFPLNLDLADLDDVAGDFTNAGATTLVLLDIGSPDDGGLDGVDDLLALAIDNDSVAMYPFFGGSDAELQPGSQSFPVTTLGDAATRGAALGGASASAVDFDDDGDDDVLLVLSIPDDPEAEPVVFRPHVFVGIADAGTLTFSERAAADSSFDWLATGEPGKPVTAGTAFYAAALLTTDFAYADADGDGTRDMVLRIGTPTIVGNVDATTSLFSFKGSDDGTFSESSFGLPEGALVRGLASAEGRVPGAALAVATSDDLLLCGAEGGAASCVSAGIAPGDTANVGVAMADLDNDGVPDLAIARGGGIEIYRQLTAQDEVGNGQ